jgi:hypothetical protein
MCDWKKWKTLTTCVEQDPWDFEFLEKRKSHYPNAQTSEKLPMAYLGIELRTSRLRDGKLNHYTI